MLTGLGRPASVSTSHIRMTVADVEVQQELFERLCLLRGSRGVQAPLGLADEPFDLNLGSPLHRRPLGLSLLHRLLGLGTELVDFLKHAVHRRGCLRTVLLGVLDGALFEGARLLLPLTRDRFGPVVGLLDDPFCSMRP